MTLKHGKLFPKYYFLQQKLLFLCLPSSQPVARHIWHKKLAKSYKKYLSHSLQWKSGDLWRMTNMAFTESKNDRRSPWDLSKAAVDKAANSEMLSKWNFWMRQSSPRWKIQPICPFRESHWAKCSTRMVCSTENTFPTLKNMQLSETWHAAPSYEPNWDAIRRLWMVCLTNEQ